MQRAQCGGLLIEVLVTIVILAIGLLGLMQMQGRLQKSEVESYQRSQALMLANDMASRISANRADADSYIVGDPDDPSSLGGGACTAASSTDPLSLQDRAEWCNALRGAAEVQASGNVGGLINGRGCVYELVDDEEYMVTVVWQGLTPISAPPVICGKESPNPYDGATGSDCVDDLCRRYVTNIVRLGNLPP